LNVAEDCAFEKGHPCSSFCLFLHHFIQIFEAQEGHIDDALHVKVTEDAILKVNADGSIIIPLRKWLIKHIVRYGFNQDFLQLIKGVDYFAFIVVSLNFFVCCNLLLQQRTD